MRDHKNMLDSYNVMTMSVFMKLVKQKLDKTRIDGRLRIDGSLYCK